MEIKEQEIKICCEKPMKNLGDVAMLSDSNSLSCFRYICLECGTITDIHTFTLDDEELWVELENNDNDEEIKNSTIYQEMEEQQDLEREIDFSETLLEEKKAELNELRKK